MTTPATATLRAMDKDGTADIQQRLQRLTADTAPLWGRMTAAQAVAHCAIGVEMALGDVRPPRMLIGHVLGPIFKRVVLGNDSPMRPNSPTAPELVVRDKRDFEVERGRLAKLVERLGGVGDGTTTHPHPFFGRLTPTQWSQLQYKHLDHHLRQFGM